MFFNRHIKEEAFNNWYYKAFGEVWLKEVKYKSRLTLDKAFVLCWVHFNAVLFRSPQREEATKFLSYLGFSPKAVGALMRRAANRCVYYKSFGRREVKNEKGRIIKYIYYKEGEVRPHYKPKGRIKVKFSNSSAEAQIFKLTLGAANVWAAYRCAITQNLYSLEILGKKAKNDGVEMFF